VARGAQVRLDIVRWDEVDLALEARLLEVAEVAPDTAVVDIGEEEEEAVDTGEAAAAESAEAEGSVTVVDPAPQTDVSAT
jgi:exoribonuclease-2